MNIFRDQTRAEMIEGAKVIIDDRLETASVRIHQGRITGIDVARDGAAVVPGQGRILAPAFVDIHSATFERHIMPVAGAARPADAALLETDRQMTANGIATAYHALTLSGEPGLHSVDTAWQIVRGLEALHGRLTADNRIQLRWESLCPEAKPLIAHVLGTHDRPALAFHDQDMTAALQADLVSQDCSFDLIHGVPATDFSAPSFLANIAERVERGAMAASGHTSMIAGVWDRRAEVPDSLANAAPSARAQNAKALSQSESQRVKCSLYRGMGTQLAQFPSHQEVYLAAREAGDMIVMGAPNAMQGRNHLGGPSAAEMIARGLCDILASDCFFPSMLGAVVRLLADKLAPLPALWNLVSANPAAAMGLFDRGRIAPGMRADLVLMDWPEGGAPSPLRTWVSRRGGYSAVSAPPVFDYVN